MVFSTEGWKEKNVKSKTGKRERTGANRTFAITWKEIIIIRDGRRYEMDGKRRIKKAGWKKENKRTLIRSVEGDPHLM